MHARRQNFGRKRLDNYIRTYRRRARLSQEDVAFLLGKTSETTVSRHEKRQRMPAVDTALSYEIIFGKSVAELYKTLFRCLRRDIAKRATALLAKGPTGCLENAARNKRAEKLARIADESTNKADAS